MVADDMAKQKCEVSAEDIDRVFADVSDLIEEIDKLFESDSGRMRKAEKLCEQFYERVSFFQEMPHLLDKHIKGFVDRLVAIIKKNFSNCSLKMHTSFKFLHSLSKTRGYKGLVRHLPHEVEDVAPVLNLLLERDPESTVNWETNYMLLLWLSLLLLIPLSIKRFDTNQGGDQVTTSDK